MELRVSDQLNAAVLSLMLGVVAGMIYDTLGEIRRRIGSKVVAGILDTLYWLICLSALFTLGLSAGGGNQRLFISALAVVGIILYFLLLGRAFREILNFFGDGIGYIGDTLCAPLKKLWNFSINLLLSVKKLFSYWKKRYKIGVKNKASTRAERTAHPRGDKIEIQTYRYFYEVNNYTTADLRSDKPNETSRENSRRNSSSIGAGTAGGRHHRR
jgi:hypothetical protein